MKHRGHRSIPVGQFKAHCLRLLAQVQTTKEVLVITKRGKAMARIVPSDEPETTPLTGSVTICGDIVAPISEQWDADT